MREDRVNFPASRMRAEQEYSPLPPLGRSNGCETVAGGAVAFRLASGFRWDRGRKRHA